MVCGWNVAPLRGKISLGTDLNVTTAKRTYVLSIKIYGPGEQHNRSHNEKEVDPQNSWFVFMSHNCYSPLYYFQIQTLWKFGNTSCNPVLRTEIVGLHSSQGSPPPPQGSTIGDCLFMWTVTCWLLIPPHIWHRSWGCTFAHGLANVEFFNSVWCRVSTLGMPPSSLVSLTFSQHEIVFFTWMNYLSRLKGASWSVWLVHEARILHNYTTT